MNSRYQTPETNSEFKREVVATSGRPKWSSKTVCLLTFFPMSLCLVTSILMQLSEDFFFLAAFVVPISGFVIAILTAINFHRAEGVTILGYVILWLVVHAALIGLGFFGCVTIIMR